MQGANFVAIRVAQVGQVQLAYAAVAPARRVFARGTTVGDARCVERIGLLGRLHIEADRAAVAVGRGLTVEWVRNAKATRGRAIKVAVDQAVVVGHAGLDAQRP